MGEEVQGSSEAHFGLRIMMEYKFTCGIWDLSQLSENIDPRY